MPLVIFILYFSVTCYWMQSNHVRYDMIWYDMISLSLWYLPDYLLFLVNESKCTSSIQDGASVHGMLSGIILSLCCHDVFALLIYDQTLWIFGHWITKRLIWNGNQRIFLCFQQTFLTTYAAYHLPFHTGNTKLDGVNGVISMFASRLT